MRTKDKARTVKATERSLAIVEALQRLNGARVTELAEELEISKSTVFNHLATLQNRGYVVMEGDEYHLGLRFSNLGQYARNRKQSYVWARELADYLESKTNLESAVVVEENGIGMYLKSETGEMTDPNIYPQVGGQVYLHATAVGTAILSELPREDVEWIAERWGLQAQTANTITDLETLFDELERVRKRGYAVNEGENSEGVRAVGVPIFEPNATGALLGAVSVSGPKYRMSGEWLEEELPEKVLSLIERFEGS
jgi:DNA-binding IclR family transcriptional regulator